MKKRILILTGILALGIASHFYINQKYIKKEKKITSQKMIPQKVQEKRVEIEEKKDEIKEAVVKVENKYRWNLNDIYS
ncbi:MAG: hypothetical protein WBG30_09895, partial [Psychrilyobacter sp.]